jgi:hypothetical protein
VRLVEGSSVAELTAELVVGDETDNAKHAAWYWSRFSSSVRATAERLSKAVTVYVRFVGLVGVRRFQGLSTDLSVSSTDRTATLRALDLRESLRTDVAVPAVGADFGPGTIIKPGLNAQWIVDYAFRKNGYGATPLHLDNATDTVLVSATMHGSAYPDVGTLLRAGWYTTATGDHDVCTFTTGTYGYALTGPVMSGAVASQYNVAEYRFTTPVQLPMNTWDYIAGELYLSGVPGAMTGTTPQMLLNVYNARDPDIITLEIRDVAGVRKLRLAFSRGTSGAGFIDADFTATTYVRWMIQHTGPGRTLRIWQDGVTPSTSGSYLDAALPVDTGMMDRVRVSALGVVEGFTLVYAEPGANVIALAGHNYSPQVDLGPSRNELVAAVATESRNTWELLKEVAAAEYAWVAWDDYTARPFYRTQDFWAETAQQTVSATVTADRDLLELSYDDGMAQLRNQISAPVKNIIVTGLEDVWSGPLYVHARTTRRFFVEFDNPVIDLDTSVQSVVNNLPGVGSSRVHANARKDGTGLDLSTYISVTVEFWTASTAMLRVTNRASAFGAYVTDGASGPGLFLAGSRIIADQNNLIAYDEDAASVDQFGPQPLRLSENPWRQDEAVAKGTIGGLLARLAHPDPTPVGLRILGNPLLQLGDRVRIQDPDGTELDDEYWITGLDDEIRPTGYTQALAVRKAWTVAVWNTSLWDDGTVWGP